MSCPVCGGDDCRPVPPVGRLARWAGGAGLDVPDPDEVNREYEPKRRRKKKRQEGVEV